MANEKSKAEQYRDERKARIAKNAKKNAKNMEAKNTAKKIVGKVISIVLVAAIALGCVGGILNYYGVWQRLMPIGGVGADVNFNMAEYEFYYMSTYNQVVNMAQQYSSQGYDIGYDTSLSLLDQTGVVPTDFSGMDEEATWAEFIEYQAILQLQQYNALYNEAKKAGFELSDADQKTIDETIESYKEQAEATGESSDGTAQPKFSLNAYLRKMFGSFMNSSFMRKMLEKQLLVQNYQDAKVDELSAGYEQSEIDKVYNEDKTAYDLVDMRVYTFSTTQLTAEEDETDEELEARQKKADAEVKANADKFLAGVKDEKSFMAQATSFNKDDKEYDADSSTKYFSKTNANTSENFGEEISKWAFDTATKNGDVKLFTSADSTSYTIVLMVKTMHQVDTVNVRHILFATVDTSTGEALSDEDVKKAKENADAALKSFNEGDKTEDSFAALATELTEDTGSQSTGGLYDAVVPGQMVASFNDWCFDASRKTGDVEIVETEYGYHVMYFVGKGSQYYNETIRSSKASEDFSADIEELIDGDSYVVSFGPRRKAYAEKEVNKKIQNLVDLNSSSSASTGTTY